MELKKNPKKDLNRKSGMYFATGMFLVLMFTYVALEWKTFFEIPDFNTAMYIEEDLNEDIELFTIETPPPPKPITTPPVIEIITNDEEIKETIIEAVDLNQDTEIAEIEEIPVLEIEEEIDVDWISIEEVPIFPGCENENDKRACFQKMINKHIIRVFQYPKIAQEMGVEGKVFTQFTINKDGSIGNILLRSPDKTLEKEAQRIISKLPKMTPGKQRDRNVKVAFAIPIVFRLR